MGKHRARSRAKWIWLSAGLVLCLVLAWLVLTHHSKEPIKIDNVPSATSIQLTTTPAATMSPPPTPSAPTTTAVPTTTTPAPIVTTSRPAAPAVTTTNPPPVDNSYAAQVINITNRYRAEAGCGSVVRNQSLMDQALYHTYQQAAKDNMEHSPAGPTGFQTWGENVAHGYETPDLVMTAWMNSPHHKENILNCTYTQIGVGYVPTETNNGPYWTQQFGA